NSGQASPWPRLYCQPLFLGLQGARDFWRARQTVAAQELRLPKGRACAQDIASRHRQPGPRSHPQGKKVFWTLSSRGSERLGTRVMLCNEPASSQHSQDFVPISANFSRGSKQILRPCRVPRMPRRVGQTSHIERSARLVYKLFEIVVVSERILTPPPSRSADFSPQQLPDVRSLTGISWPRSAWTLLRPKVLAQGSRRGQDAPVFSRCTLRHSVRNATTILRQAAKVSQPSRKDRMVAKQEAIV